MKRKSKNIFFYFITVLLVFMMVCGMAGCKKALDEAETQETQKKQTSDEDSKKVSEGVISLLDSLGVGDVPNYPGSVYDNELNDGLGEYKDQLIEIPAEFFNVLYMVYATGDTVSEVVDFYNLKMQELQWEKSLDLVSGNSSFNLWKKAGYDGEYISYIVLTGEIQYRDKKEVVILKGFVIPESLSGEQDYTEDTAEEGSEIGPGAIYFENPMPPEGQGLLQTKAISGGIDEWDQWLQGGTKVEGTNKVSLKDDPIFFKVVEFYRTSDPGDGGAAGIYQKLDIDLKQFSKVNVWIVGKVIKEKGHNIANVNYSYFPEGAVQVRLKYLAENGEEKEWYHSFFYSNIYYYDKLHYSLVTRHRWFWYISPNLLELNNKPVKIKEIQVYGFGWEFTGQVAEVNIIGY
ncbi:MAG: hypothetical protein FJW69_04730 [Actinobacteria bacterium]|nr:hypothetical protein [Actinomycetota bacterium]